MTVRNEIFQSFPDASGVRAKQQCLLLELWSFTICSKFSSEQVIPAGPLCPRDPCWPVLLWPSQFPATRAAGGAPGVGCGGEPLGWSAGRCAGWCVERGLRFPRNLVMVKTDGPGTRTCDDWKHGPCFARAFSAVRNPLCPGADRWNGFAPLAPTPSSPRRT